ncbi:MAG: hypothetical protein AB1726_17665 [Planctomycetota bacterium]
MDFLRPGRPAILALLAGGLLAAGEPASGLAPAGPRIFCTPDTLCLPGGTPQAAEHPIARALEKAAPGTVIVLDPGTYQPFTIGFRSSSRANARTAGGRPGLPIVVQGRGEVRIAGAQGDTIAIDQAQRCGHITFRGLTIFAGERAGIMFYRQPADRPHVGFHFEDCDVLGRYDHLRAQGRKSKWGVWGHNLADFRFAGVSRPARVEGIQGEHGFYLQNPRGEIVIENVEGRFLGRTFCQFTARAAEGPPGTGAITIRNCRVEDVGVGAGDGYKGGSAFTFAGRLTGPILLERNVYHAGFRKDWRVLTTPGVPYGTGALAAWQGGEALPNASLTLRDNEFRFAPGCGDRPVVAIGGCREVKILGANRFQSGGGEPALALDPVDDAGRPLSPPNGAVRLAPTTHLEGAVTIGPRPATAAELSALAR